ncbi:MAG TPA: alpha-amylase family glycosyl hydrolase [Kiritimatiellia bacterium]|nr:alpha-amylase family glycosyl hydrolase [Kiritimatiellia bacterium]
MRGKQALRNWVVGLIAAGMVHASPVRAEVMLQFFNLTWQELIDKMPEIAETGYTSLWLPPPQKASGDLSVGYDLWDPFDLGGNPQRTGGRTRYGTEEEMLRMIETAHRFGLRVYFDNIMNHRAFDIPGFNENTPVDIYPGMLPEDFHLQVTEEGFYRPWGNTVNWGSTWEVQNRYLSGLIDIAHEASGGGLNANFGPNEGDTHPGISFVRHPNNPEYYDFHPTEGHVGFGSPLITTNLIAENPGFYSEDVGGYLMRSIRWLVDYTKLDGLRLDAVKHVPAYFFGQQDGPDKDFSDAGYIGQAQWQFNKTRGFIEGNYRASVFDVELPRVSLMVFGEHMGAPPPYDEYWNSGMRLLDARTHSTLNNLSWLPNLFDLQTSEYIEGFQMGKSLGVYYAKSHDDDVAFNEHLQYAINLTRAGLPNIYTDGNRQAPTLGDSGGAFPRHANTRPFGQFGDTRIPNLVHIHNSFARGDQIPRWGDEHVLSYERRDKRENWDMSDADGTVMHFMMNRDWGAGHYREIPTTFPDGSILWQYADGGGKFYHQVTDGRIKVTVPPAGYFVFSWRSPEESHLWKWGGGNPIELYSNGQPADTIQVVRWDGPDGDSQFNPFGYPNRGYPDGVDPVPFTYMHPIPRVTSATNLSFFVHADGSAYHAMLKLNGGVPLNNQQHFGGDDRDHPPGWDTTDVYLGYENMTYHHRIGPEKFGSVNALRNKIGSAGAETYEFTVGSPGFTIYQHGSSNNNFDGTYTAAFVYHDPQNQTDDGWSQFWPPPQDASGQDIWFQVKVGNAGQANRVFVYYTTDGTWPEGAGGMGIGSTRVVELFWRTNWLESGGETNDWWSENNIPPLPAGTTVRYKVSATRQHMLDNASVEALFPNDWDSIGRKQDMMGTWKIENFNPSTVTYYPHNDYGIQRTGLVEGFNMLAARVFLRRDGAGVGNDLRASIYNTFYQPFYYDAAPPAGEVVFPAQNQTLTDNRFGIVVRTDPTVTRVWYNIVDNDANNDDSATGSPNGNGQNALGNVSWVEAQRVNPNININSEYPLEWRFNYVNIPASGSATIRVKLAEHSSSTNPLLSDAAGRFTTLERSVTANGPDYRMNVAWPQNDGDTVSAGYVMKVNFSANLSDWDEEVTRSRFLISLNGIPQNREEYTFNYFVEANTHELGFTLPDLFNGDPNYEHEISVVHTNAAGQGVSLFAERRVRVPQGAGGPSVLIIDPPEFDINGGRYQIVLPDVANPTPAQRQHNVIVQTGTDAQSVWISFTNSTGTVVPVPASTNTLSGTLSVTTNSTAVAGAGTLFNDQVSAGSVLQIGSVRVVVASVVSSNALTLTRPFAGPSGTGLTAQRITGNPTPVGNSLFWNFTWTNIQRGTYTLVANVDTDGNPAVINATNQRTTTVIFRQMVNPDTSGDSDNDGLPDTLETQPVPLPETNPETWSNGDVHIWVISGRSDPLMPSTDGGGLPDGLQLGLSGPINPAATDLNADTNGDGWPNFIADRDPPIYNTTDNWQHPAYNFNASRTDQIGGSITDPSRADTDNDGLPDHLEDLNRNGRVDVGLLNGQGVVTNVLRSWYEHQQMFLPTIRNTSIVDRDALPANARFLETDPNNRDTIGDSMSDGAADVNANGRVDMTLLYANGTNQTFDISLPANHIYLVGMDAASQAALAAAGEPSIVSRAINYTKLFEDFGRPRRVNGVWQDTNKWPRILFNELDPLVRDTNQDGLDDGWKIRFGLDPWDDGWYNLRTGHISPTNTQQGGDGDLTGDGITNIQHKNAGTDPRADVNIPVPPGSITIGRGPQIGELNGQPVFEEFMDWTWDDLRALDYYHGGGINSKQGDVYRGWDGFDESRDLVAFYTRDGGPSSAGGDDRFYFRVDMYDLQAFAEESHLDIYVVIDTGNPAIGERVLPDEVDTLTDMRWELVVAVYNSASGRVYVDMNPNQNTSVFSEDLFSFGGVVGREDYFYGAYFNSQLDAVEFSINRQALLDVGYIGDPSVLNFQVFTTKSGTCNSCDNGGPGGGDIGGRSDIRDSILNDYIAEDEHWAQDGLRGAGSVLRQWIRGDARPNRTKLAKIVHGNQAIQPGSIIQDLVNNNAGAGYFRVLDTHEVFGAPLNMHITPTLASAIQWASVDPAAGQPWRDGPSLNARIGELARTNLIALMASTFSDHMLPYFTPEFIADNVELATEFLETIYGVQITTNSVFWTPERLFDQDVFQKIAGLGFRATVVDQMEHLFKWYGRTSALGTRGYQINRIEGVDTFAINNGANDFRFANHDIGLSMPLRRLFNRKARGDWDQVIVLMSNWEDFTSKTLADAYDLNMRWIANRPWIKTVTLEDILTEQIDLDGSGSGNAWYVEDRGSLVGQPKLSHNYINYANQGNYDNWYLGSVHNEGLVGKVFPGTTTPYGMLYTGGIVSSAWNRVQSVTNVGLSALARGVIHASVFQTAFHEQNWVDLRKFSNGEYINPNFDFADLAGFAKVAQAQTRKAAIYQRVNQWLATAASLTQATVQALDVDLDGQNEYLLYNDRIFALFERSGGRLVAAWTRDPDSGQAFQVIGNLHSYAGVEDEWEGAFNVHNDGRIEAYRTSALKDWWAGTTDYVNDQYTFTNWTNGWRISSSDGQIVKTVTLDGLSNWLTVNYNVNPALNGGTLFVRNGLSPDLHGLLLHGQNYLGPEQHNNGTLTLSQVRPGLSVSAMIAYGGPHNATYNPAAVDDNPGAGIDFTTLRMRNQAQTHQVELSGTGNFSFAIGFEATASGEQFNDIVPYSWLIANGFDPEAVNVFTQLAANGVDSLRDAYIANLDPNDPTDRFILTQSLPQTTGIRVSFATKTERDYLIWYNDNGLNTPTWYLTSSNRIQGTGAIYDWDDDGSLTDPHPFEATNRTYKIQVELP